MKAKQNRINVVLILVVLSVLGAAAWAYYSRCDSFDCRSVREFVSSFGAWAPLVFALLYVASSPVPFLETLLGSRGQVVRFSRWHAVYGHDRTHIGACPFCAGPASG
jgi:hypothetical protein